MAEGDETPRDNAIATKEAHRLAAMVGRIERNEGTCTCPTCRLGRALRDVDGAIEEWLERECEADMAFHYLVDELTEALACGNWIDQKARLANALRIATR